jgi:cell division protein FtsQ
MSRARAGNRWQPVIGARLNRRVAGRRAWRLPKLYLPEIAARWRRSAVVLVLGAALGVGGWWLYQSPLLTIRSVGVEGNSALVPDVVRNIADVKGERLFQPDFESAEARLRAMPLIKEVDISHDWPFGAKITIVERRPWGYWEAGGQRVVIDGDGVVIDLPPGPGAPVVVQNDMPVPLLEIGDQVDPNAVGVAARLAETAQQTLGRPLVSLEFSQSEGLVAVLDGDLRVLIGDARSYDFKLATLSAIIARADSQGETISRVDLRFGDRATYQ